MQFRGQTTDAELYNDENELLGIAEEFQIPAMETTQIEQEALGAVGVLKLPARGLKALDGSIKLLYPAEQLLLQMARPNKTVSFHLHEKVDLFDVDGFNEEASTTLITHVKVMFSKVDNGGSKLSEARETTGEFSAHYVMQRLISSNVPLIEVDLFNNIYNVNGEPVWPS